MGVLEFLCDRRFHQSFILPPDPTVGREKPYRFSYADFGDSRSNAVVLFCGALMATRFSYAPLDQLATKYNVRIIHPDRPGVGGSDPVELEKRIQTWLEIVPKLLEHLNIDHVSLASHSGGVIYLLNTMLTYPHLLHPKQPYACFFAPWVHPSHSKVAQMQVTEFLPAPMIGKFATAAKFINDNVMPLSGFSSSLIEGSKSSFPLMAPRVAVPLDPAATSTPFPSDASEDAYRNIALDDPNVIEQLRALITQYMFAERTDGISADAQLFMRKPRSISWGSPSMQWSDLDYFVPFFTKLLNEDSRVKSRQRVWVIDAVHAASDNMVGEKGRQWFDKCWVREGTSPSNEERDASPAEHQASHSPYEYTSSVVKETDHNFLMDPRFGASELWLKKVRDCSVT